jgi:hypothetical protein
MDVNATLAEFKSIAEDLTGTARSEILKAFDSLGRSDLYAFKPYQYKLPSPPSVFPVPMPIGPQKPSSPGLPVEPTLVEVGMNVPSPTFGVAPTDKPTPPVIQLPSQPGDAPADFTGTAPTVATPSFPVKPALFALPSSTLPYPTVTIPTAPAFTPPTFEGVAPGDIATLTVDEYLTKLTDTYANYSTLIPALVQSNCFTWFRAMVGENPNIRKIDGIISSYLDTGGAGTPTPIEEAIVTRATDRVGAEARRKRMGVWEKVAAYGFSLPSGALMSGLKEERATMAEAVSKVATDVAIENLKLEHDHMKFMTQLGVELQKVLLSFAGETANTVTALNAQSIEMTKLVLTGLIEVNNIMVKVYLAKWEGFKAAVEVFRAKWMGIEAQIRAYEAQIRAELAKTEVNKSVVAVLEAMVHANQAVVAMYKTQVEAETAKIEADRVRVMAFEAIVRAYVAKVEAFRARWEGYRAAVEGQVAVSHVYESQVRGYTAEVEAYRANVQAYGEEVRGFSAQVEAISRQNETALKAWATHIDGLYRAYGEDVKAYGLNWSAIGEQMRAAANVLGIQSEFLTKMYNVSLTIEMENARDNLAQWEKRLEAGLRSSEGMVSGSHVAAQLAGAVLSGYTTFAGNLATSQVPG